MSKLAIGDSVTVRGNPYGHFRVHEFLPRKRPPHLVRVLHSTSDDFSVALIKTFRISDLRKKY